MKRFGALLMCVLMLASLAMPAYAADGNVYTITPSQTSAVAGDEIVFTVSVSGSTAVKSLGFIPSYDSSVYELVGGQPVMSGLVSTVDKNHGGTAVLFLEATVPSGVVGTFTLKVIAETATTGTVSASVSQNTGDASVVAASVEITAGEPEHTHTIQHVEAVAAACHYEGNIEYWYCSDAECMMVWADEALTQLTNLKNVVTPALGGEVEHVAESCYNTEYWRCDSCEQVWADEALTQLTNIKNVNKAEATHVIEAVAESCYNTAYWYCSACETYWADEALTQITNVKNVNKAEATHALVHVEAKEPAVGVEGNIEHWYCEACETVWSDEALTQITNFKSVIIPALEEEEGCAHAGLVHMEAVEAACHYEGNIEYWVCYDCEIVWQDAELTQVTNIKNVVKPATGGEVVHMEAVEAACHYEGNIEHWICYDCEQVWADEALTQLTNIKNVVKPAIGGEVVHVEAKAPTATEDGNMEYWYCESCEQVWQDEALTQVTNIKNVILPATGEEEGCAHAGLVHMDAVEPGCHYDGNIEYWICYDCETVWADEALTQLTNIKNVVKPAIGGEVVHVAESCYNIEYWHCESCEQVWQDEALTQLTNIKNVNKAEASHEVEHVAESCYNTEYWTCSVCETYWADEALTQITNAKNVIKAEASHELQHVEAVAATCTADGNIEYWTCSVCETYWADEALTQITNSKNVIVPAAHNEIHVEAVAATCNGMGNIEHWYCDVCGAHWLENGMATNAQAVILPALGCTGTHVEAKDPTCTATGNVEHWYCESCGSYYADEACTQLTNVKNVTVAANGHSFDKDGICTVCGASETQTGDNAMIMAWVAVMALSAAAAVILVFKKRYA